jgi:hypothetical protein
MTSNRCNPLSNVVNDDDSLANTGRVSESTSNHVRRDKEKNHKRNSLKSKVHKFLILDSHARGCTAEVKHQISNEYEVFDLINPGSRMKDIKESANREIAQLTREYIVVLRGGSNDVARYNSVMGRKHTLDLLINSTHSNVILLSLPHRHDLIKDLRVNREVKVFNESL